ncbi:hypothetical protein [Caulobacter vibrioides]|uniref:Chemotaxis protein CheZ n=2 Tax=Caulobacter vibrioides TaxID=155892 RepID=Q9AAK7_CAUVC|nr:hypothetical protein [Caulobacter vibrioides]YP_002516000.1 hypothetical protein CCNA_00627 [Caulobacter vibrioides NA1000]AAK22576.1 hypothetical protein CC_0590 [Caulobacter vibrioides CB15]ACL94092.1 hypothetical protein CCNA_00627 [Caulobacter vibrioides NA1000]ATC27435.1 hypothetical protein CA607_03155 [Caulobacter vibrioides]QXZ52673.1 hypothetical protein KZH45_03060 [Caulobacter vibrioides]
MTARPDLMSDPGGAPEADLQAAICSLNPARFAGERIGGALVELQAARQDVEKAVERILAEAEAMLDGDTSVERAIAVMEACAVHDIVGQRLTKVEALLAELDRRLARLAGAAALTALPEPESPSEARQRELWLNGPARPAEGLSQADADRLFE